MKLFDDGTPTDFQSIARRLAASLGASGLISDTSAGGVAQVLTETFAREMATFYAVLERVHEAGYLETAREQALDYVVAVLGIKRAQPGRLRGVVVLSRGTPAPDRIAIPTGTLVTGPPDDQGQAQPLLETVEQASIPRGRRSAAVAVQEVEAPEGEATGDGPANLPPGSLTIMPRPLLGVEQVQNPDPVTRGGTRETDDHLRARAAAALREGQKGTVEAIEAAVRALGVQVVKVLEAPDGRAGCIEVRVGDPALENDPARQRQVEEAVRATKAAGIHLKLEFLRSVRCRPTLQVQTEQELEPADFEALAQSLAAALRDMIKALAPGAALALPRLQAAVLADPQVSAVDLALETYTLDYAVPEGQEPRKVVDTGERELPGGGWYMGPLENATVDEEGWPQVGLKETLRARLDLSVTVPSSGLAADTVRQNVRAAADDHVKRLKPGDDGGTRVAFDELLAALGDKAQVTALAPTCLVHEADGLAEDLGPGQGATLAAGERLTVGSVDVMMEVDQ